LKDGSWFKFRFPWKNLYGCEKFSKLLKESDKVDFSTGSAAKEKLKNLLFKIFCELEKGF